MKNKTHNNGLQATTKFVKLKITQELGQNQNHVKSNLNQYFGSYMYYDWISGAVPGSGNGVKGYNLGRYIKRTMIFVPVELNIHETSDKIAKFSTRRFSFFFLRNNLDITIPKPSSIEDMFMFLWKCRKYCKKKKKSLAHHNFKNPFLNSQRQRPKSDI